MLSLLLTKKGERELLVGKYPKDLEKVKVKSILKLPSHQAS